MSNRSRSRLFTFALAIVLAAMLAGPASGMVDESKRGPNAVQPKPTKAERVVDIALDAVGTPYRWGGESPASGFDCSGLVRWAYGRVGVALPHNSCALYGQGKRVPESGMRPGDILFFEGLGHVGLYLGRGRMVHAPQTGRHVEVVRLARTNYGARLIGARRVIAA
ncbi:MAG TPA: C40 family peptidase [Gaiellaceae bacterium]|nr:C40 family peptidase [Gaiellaceae bacterium]